MSVTSITRPAHQPTERRELPAAEVMAEIHEADALHETACDVYDIATRDLEAARQALADAARRLTEAEGQWNVAGSQMDALARRVAAMRQSAGVVFTATGYRPRS